MRIILYSVTICFFFLTIIFFIKINDVEDTYETSEINLLLVVDMFAHHTIINHYKRSIRPISVTYRNANDSECS